MYPYSILTDSSCDLDAALLAELEVSAVQLHVRFQGREYENSALRYDAFYEGLRAGEQASTSAVNPDRWAAAMRPLLESGQDVLVLAFSSGLSATCQSARLAAEELQAKYPNRKIAVVDTLCACAGEGLLVYTCARMRQAGQSMDEVRSFAERNRLRVCHWYTVDDLAYLKRGGRISSSTALFGTLLQIKPVMHMDNAGKLCVVSKARGRRAALEAIVKQMKSSIERPEQQEIFLSHADCPDDAAYLSKRIREELPVQQVHIGSIGPVIGAHSGPGTVAVFYFGKQR